MGCKYFYHVKQQLVVQIFYYLFFQNLESYIILSYFFDEEKKKEGIWYSAVSAVHTAQVSNRTISWVCWALNLNIIR